MIRDKRGWVVWTWSKLGAMLVFFAVMLMLLSSYSLLTSTVHGVSSNQVARDFRNAMSDTYNAPGGMTCDYELPETIEGRNYSIELTNKTGDSIGILVRTEKNGVPIVGGASAALPLAAGSFGILKETSENLPNVCIIKKRGRLSVEKSEC